LSFTPVVVVVAMVVVVVVEVVVVVAAVAMRRSLPLYAKTQKHRSGWIRA